MRLRIQNINDDGVKFKILVHTKTNLILGDKPHTQEKGLPQLKMLDKDPERGKIELSLPIFSDWDTLNALIVDSLNKHPVSYNESYAILKLSQFKLKAVPNELALVSAVISIEPTGIIKRMLLYFEEILQKIGWTVSLINIKKNEEFEITVKPIVSEDGTRVVLKNAKLTQDSSKTVEILARTYSELTNETIEKIIEEHAVIDLNTLLDEAENDAQKEINKFEKKLEESDISLKMEIQPITRISSVSVDMHGLVAKFCAVANIDEFKFKL